MAVAACDTRADGAMPCRGTIRNCRVLGTQAELSRLVDRRPGPGSICLSQRSARAAGAASLTARRTFLRATTIAEPVGHPGGAGERNYSEYRRDAGSDRRGGNQRIGFESLSARCLELAR